MKKETNEKKALIERAYVEAGRNYFYDKNFQKALDKMDEALEKGIRTPSILRYKAMALFGLGNLKEAIEEVTNALKIEPTNSLTLWHMSYLQWEDNNIEEAINYAEQAHRQDPTSLGIKNNLAWFYAERKGPDDLNRALDLANKIVDRDPTNTSFLETRAFVYIGLGQLGNAEADLSCCLEMGRDSSFVYWLLGTICKSREEQTKAQKHFTKAKELTAVDPHRRIYRQVRQDLSSLSQ